MPPKLKFEFVRDFINKEEKLVSTTYANNKELLTIVCKQCGCNYFQIFLRWKNGHRHQGCTNVKPRIVGRKKVTLKMIECGFCHEEFQSKRSSAKYCSSECSQENQKTEEYKAAHLESARRGGIQSAFIQQRRSKNEILMAELCQKEFGADQALNNRIMFGGWDCDIIIPSKKIAILWNGIWHHKEMSEVQSLLKVQTRDEIRIEEIIKCGYVPYIIKDLGSHDVEFVEKQFKLFMERLPTIDVVSPKIIYSE